MAAPPPSAGDEVLSAVVAAAPVLAQTADEPLVVGKATELEEPGVTVNVGETLSEGVAIVNDDGFTFGISRPGADAPPVEDDHEEVVFPTEDADEPSDVVQLTEDGALRLLTVFKDKRAARNAVYDLDLPKGTEVVLLDDGSLIFVRAADGSAVASVDAPWAVDGNGEHLTTSYKVVGEKLVQHIDFSGAAFPVTADPVIRPGYTGINVYYNKSETRFWANGPSRTDSALAGIFCGVLPGPAKAQCLLAGFGHWDRIEATAKTARRRGICISIFHRAIPRTAQEVRTYSGTHCR